MPDFMILDHFPMLQPYICVQQTESVSVQQTICVCVAHTQLSLCGTYPQLSLCGTHTAVSVWHRHSCLCVAQTQLSLCGTDTAVSVAQRQIVSVEHRNMSLLNTEICVCCT